MELNEILFLAAVYIAGLMVGSILVTVCLYLLYRTAASLVRVALPQGLTVEDLVDRLNRQRGAGLEDPDTIVQKVHDWLYEKYKLVVQAALAATGGIVAAFFVPFAKGDFATRPWWQVALIVVITFTAPWYPGFVFLRRLNGIERRFLGALELLYSRNVPPGIQPDPDD